MNGRLGIVGGQDLVRAAVAGKAGWSLLVAVLAGDGVNSKLVAVDRVFVAGGALLRHEFFGALHFVRLAVATGAGFLAQDRVHALGNLRGFLVVASGAGGHAHRLGVRILFHAHMAGGAAQIAVHAAFVFGGIDVQALAGLGFHSRIAVASQALLISGQGRQAPRATRAPRLSRRSNPELFSLPSCNLDSSLAIGKQHGVDDPDHDAEADAQRDPGKGADRAHHDFRLRLFEMRFQLARWPPAPRIRAACRASVPPAACGR